MRRENDRPLYMISVAAELAGVHPQTLRIYERKRLVQPQRSSGNTRLYSQADVERLQLIQQLTQEGINLAGVVRIIELQREVDRTRAELAHARARLARAETAARAAGERARMREVHAALVRVTHGPVAKGQALGGPRPVHRNRRPSTPPTTAAMQWCVGSKAFTTARRGAARLEHSSPGCGHAWYRDARARSLELRNDDRSV
jgi:MerR family transcriptional regulator, heat shock protein HspR